MRRNLLLEFIINDVLQARPEIHGQRPQLYLHIYPARILEQDKRHLENNMKALIAVRLRIGDIVLDFRNPDIVAGLQMIENQVDVFDERAYDPHSSDVIDLVHNRIEGERKALALQFIENAAWFLETCLNMLDWLIAVAKLPLPLG